MGQATTAQHIVITGAAGALGQAAARHFQSQGARLALLDRAMDRLGQVFAGLDTARHALFEVDVTSAASAAQAAKGALAHLGHVDALVHIAGGFEMGPPVHELSRDAWNRMMDLNAWSFAAVSQAFVPSMVQRGSGSVVAVSAKTAARGLAAMSAYIASKSALQRLVEAAAAELAPHGIRVNSIAPSVLDTPANRDAMPDADRCAWVSTDVAAATIGYLISPAAAALQGQHLALGA